MRRLWRTIPLTVPLICAALMIYVAVLGVRAMQHATLSAEEIRRVLMTELSRVLKQPVTVEKVTGDVWRGVTFWGIVIGKNPRLPGGAFFRARSVTVKFDGKAILTGRVSAAEGIRQIVVDQWSAHLARDRQGQWNFQYLLKPKKPVKERKFAAQVLVQSGTVYLTDEERHGVRSLPLALKIVDVSGPIQFAGEDPVTFDVRALSVRSNDFSRSAGGATEVATTVHGVGKVNADGSFVRTTIDFERADATYGADYLFKQPQFRVESGRASGRVEIVWAKPQERHGVRQERHGVRSLQSDFSFRGGLTLHNVSAWVTWLGQRRLRNVSGEMVFNDRLVTIHHASAAVGSTPFTAKGTLNILQQVQFDLDLHSDRAQVEEVYALLGGHKLGATVKAFGTAVADAHVVGTPASASLIASAQLPRLTVQHPLFGRVSGGPWKAHTTMENFFRPVLFGDSAGAAADVSTLEFGPFHADEESKIQIEGVTDIRLQFAGIPTQPTITGTFKARRGRAGAIEFEDLQATACYHDKVFTLREAQARVADGDLKFDMDLDLSDKEPYIVFVSELEDVNTTCLQPYLAEQNWSVEGPASGKLNISGVPQKLRTEFDVQIPVGQWVKSTDFGSGLNGLNSSRPLPESVDSPFAVSLRDVHLAGRGVVERHDDSDWDFEGEAQLSMVNGQWSMSNAEDPQNPKPKTQNPTTFLVGRSTCLLRGKVTHQEDRLLPDVKGRARVERVVCRDLLGKAKEIPASNARLAFDVTSERVRLQDIIADALGGEVEGAVSIGLTDEALEGYFCGTDVDLNQLAQLAGREDVKGTGTVTVALRGRTSDPQADATLRAYGAQWNDVPFGLVDARLNVDNHHVVIQRGTLWQGGARYFVKGRIDDLNWETPDGRLSLTVDAETVRLSHALQLFGAEVDAEGLCEAELKVSGRLQDPQVTGSAQLTHGRVRRSGAAPVRNGTESVPYVFVERAEVQGIYHQRRFVLTHYEAQEREAAVEGSGSIGLDGTIELKFRGERILVESLLQQTDWKTNLEGTVYATGTLSGKVDALRVAVTIDDAALVWAQDISSHLTGGLQWDGHTLRADSLTLQQDGVTLRLDGTLPLDTDSRVMDASATGRADMEKLKSFAETAETMLRDNKVEVGWLRSFVDTVRQLPQPVMGDLNGKVLLSGSWSEPVISSASFHLDKPQLGGQDVPNLDAILGWTGKELTVQKFIATVGNEHRAVPDVGNGRRAVPVLQVAEGGRIAPDGDIALNLTVDNFDLSLLQPWLRRWKLSEPWRTNLTSLTGVANLTAQVHGKAHAPDVTATGVTVSDLRTASIALEKIHAPVVALRDEQIQIQTAQKAEVTLGDSHVTISGSIPFVWDPFGLPPRGALRVHLVLSKPVNLKALRSVFPNWTDPTWIESAEGTFTQASLDITDTVAEPRFGGLVSLRDGEVKFGKIKYAELNTTLTHLNGDFQLEEKQNVIRVQLTGTTNGRPRTAHSAEATHDGKVELTGKVTLKSGQLTEWSAHDYDLTLAVNNAQLDEVRIDLTEQVDEPSSEKKTAAGTASPSQKDKLPRERNGRSSVPPDAKLTFSGISQMNGKLRLKTENERQMLRIEHLSGKGMMGGSKENGALQLVGTVKIDPQFYTAAGWTKNDYQLTLTTNRFPLEVRNWIEKTWSTLFRGELTTAPSLTWTSQSEKNGSSLHQIVRGALVVSNADLRGIPTLPAAAQAVDLPNAPEFKALKLGIGPNVRINAPGIRAPITGTGKVSEQEKKEGLPNIAVLMTGSPQNLSITGSVEARSGGELRFPTAVMRLFSARVDFALSRTGTGDATTRTWLPRVVVDAAARGRVDDYDVNLTITGPLVVGSEATEPQIRATSSPPGLSEAQILARLAGTSGTERGTVPESQINREFQKQLVNLAQASPYIESQFFRFEENLRSMFRIDLFSLEYRLGEPTSVRLGKALGRDFFFTYRRNVSGNTQTYSLRLDYRLKGQILLGFETDERRREQITLDWTFRFGRKPE